MWKPVTGPLAAVAILVLAWSDPAGAQSLTRDQSICISGKSFDDAAIAACNRAIASGGLRGQNLGFAYHNRGAALGQKGEYDRAIADLNEAIRLNPKVPASYGQRGAAYGRKGEYDRALRDLDEAVRLGPKDAANHGNRGFVYNARGEHDRAIADFNEAIRLNPKLGGLYVGRGDSYFQKGEFARALSDMKTATGLGQKDAPERTSEIERRMAQGPAAAPPSQAAASAVPPVVSPAPAVSPVALAPAGPRVALVIGNGKYRSAPELANPANDARDLTAALRDLGFRVIEGYDLDSASMRAKIGEFGAAMTGAATTLFFYAGHGIQVGDKNYLIPVDARLERPSALSTEAVSVDTILADMETEKRINLVFLDACRDNPMSRSLAQAFGAGRSAAVGQGLAQLNAGIGTLITFATSPNRIALDGVGRNSPFTTALLRHIRTPDLEVRTLLTRVRADVIRETNERQIPWDHSSLTGEFYFRRGG
jgi:tetratricopeptide (TPR) repeat protein